MRWQYNKKTERSIRHSETHLQQGYRQDDTEVDARIASFDVPPGSSAGRVPVEAPRALQLCVATSTVSGRKRPGTVPDAIEPATVQGVLYAPDGRSVLGREHVLPLGGEPAVERNCARDGMLHEQDDENGGHDGLRCLERRRCQSPEQRIGAVHGVQEARVVEGVDRRREGEEERDQRQARGDGKAEVDAADVDDSAISFLVRDVLPPVLIWLIFLCFAFAPAPHIFLHFVPSFLGISREGESRGDDAYRATAKSANVTYLK